MHQTASTRLKTFSHHRLSSHQSKLFSLSSSPSEFHKQNKADSKLNRFFDKSTNLLLKQPKYFESGNFKKISNLHLNMNSELSAQKSENIRNLNDKSHKKNNLTVEVIKKSFDEFSTEKLLKNDFDQTDSTKFFRSETECSPKPHKKNGFSSITLLNDESVKNLNTLISPKGSLNFRLRSYTAEYSDDYYLSGQSKISKKPNYDQYSQQFKENNLNKDGSLFFEGRKENSEISEKFINEYEEGNKISFEKEKKKINLKLFENKHKRNNDSQGLMLTILKDIGKVNFLKKSQNSFGYSKLKILENARNKSLQSVKEILKNKKFVENNEFVEEQINKAYLEMKVVLDSTVTQCQNLQTECDNHHKQYLEKQWENENLSRKNQILLHQLSEAQKRNEILKESFKKYSSFEASLNNISKKFPDTSIEKLIDKLEYLEETGLNFTKKLSELEDDKLILEREKQKMIDEYEQRIFNLNKKFGEKEKNNLSLLERLNEKNDLINEANKHKESYLFLFKNVTSLFNEWNKSIKIYFNTDAKYDEEPQAQLEDPIEIINILKKMVVISTPQGLQRYLRKIIVSANKLQSRFFIEHKNDKFDPDKIYERIMKKFEQLLAENERFKNTCKDNGIKESQKKSKIKI